MRIAFLGTPAFAATSLSEFAGSGADVVCVYTQPPRPAGRGQGLRPSPVHALADTFGIEVRTPERLKGPDAVAAFAALDLDVAIVVAYGQILSQPILDAPRLGCWNLHASLLPRWRGAAPIQRAIMAGDARTGVQVMRMEAGLDTGPILLSEATPILPEDTFQTLHDRLARLGAGLLPRALGALERGAADTTPQAEDGVTYAHKLTPADQRIDWTRPAAEIDRQIRALSPAPGAWFAWPSAEGDIRVKALFSRAREGVPADAAPGTVLGAGRDGLDIAAPGGAVVITRAQREGRAAADAGDVARGLPAPIGGRVA